MDWSAWIEEQRPGIAAICRGEPDPLPTMRPLKEIVEEIDGLPKITAQRCIEVAARISGMKPEHIKSRRNAKEYVRARHLAMKLAVDRCPHMSFPEIGRAFNRDHTTVMHAQARAEERMKDPEFITLYLKARAAL